jgi:hypothetical protein
MKFRLEIRLFTSKELTHMYATPSKLSEPTSGKSTYARAALLVFALLAAAPVTRSLAAAQGQATFASPEDASRALVAAVGGQDERALIRILGGVKSLLSAEDKAQDALDRQYFVQKYRQMHRWARSHGAPTTLYIGAENWPFPIPLVLENGQWRFDSDVGSEEILFRRIGENELTAIGLCNSVLSGDASSKMHSPILFHGYYFHTLSTSDGELAAVAYPAVYRSSGVMTFIVTQSGGLSEKDLGPETLKLASTMGSYQPDTTWTSVDQGESMPRQ